MEMFSARGTEIDIESELRSILRKAGYMAGESERRADIYSCLESLFQDVRTSCKNIAIRCGGKHTVRLLEDFGDVLQVQYIIDKDISKINKRIGAYDIPVVSVVPDNVEVLIISTFDYREEIKAELRDSAVQVIDIYDYLEEKGFDLFGEYYSISKAPYEILIEKNQDYVNANNEEDKAKALDDLIWKYLDVRDLHSAIKCIKEYICCHYNGHQKKQNLLNEIFVLLGQIKEACRSRNERDIFWFWQDGAPYNLLQEMPFLKNYVKKGLFFKEAYSFTSATRAVYARILDQREECETYGTGDDAPKTHVLIEKLKQHGYDCRKITGVRQKHIKLDSYNCYNVTQMLITDRTLSELYWEALREMLLCSQPVCLLIHSGMETHLPVMAPNLSNCVGFETKDIALRFIEDGRREYWERLSKTIKYVDEEMEFLFGLLGEKTIRVIMSDHGDVLTKDSYYFTRDASHIIMAVVGAGLPPKTYTGLFNIKNFTYLIDYILKPTNEGERALFSEEIVFHVADAYDEEFIRDLISIDYAKYGLAFCGIMTERDRFVKFATGEEIYNIFPDDFTNYIQENAYQERISYLRERAGEHFIDIESNERFKNSHLLYEAVGKHRIM